MTRRPVDEAAAARHEILWDDGVLRPEGAICELSGYAGAGRCALLNLRAEALATRAAGVEVPEAVPEGPFTQVVVHLQKSREAAMADVALGCGLLAPDGELLVIGYNTLGIRSFQKQLDRLLGVPGQVRSNRRKGRVLAYPLATSTPPSPPEASHFDIAAPVAMTLRAEPGVFSGGRLDPGSALLLQHLRETAATPAPIARVLDLGCGAGTLGLQALRLLPEAEAVLLDADLRAVRSARDNAARLGLAPRTEVAWWDAQEPLPSAGPYDLVLCNPPFHTGKDVDLGPAFAMFEHTAATLRPGGQALIVANRTLPYEPALGRLGKLRTLVQQRGFKLLSLTK